MLTNRVLSVLEVNPQVNSALRECNSRDARSKLSIWKSSTPSPSVSIPAYFVDGFIAGQLIVYPDRRGGTPSAGTNLGSVVDLDVSTTQGASVPAAAIPTVLCEGIIGIYIVDADLVSMLTWFGSSERV